MKYYLIKMPKVDSKGDTGFIVDAIKVEDFKTGEAHLCTKCEKAISMLEWLPPFEIELETWGNRYADVVDVSDDLIVSSKFVKIFSSSNLVGLEEFIPVKVRKVIRRKTKIADAPPAYFKAKIVRSSTTIDQDASGYVWQDETQKCPECLFDTLLRYRCLIVKEGTWAGEDIFIPRGGRRPLVSEKFKQVFVDNGLEGLVFFPSHLPEAGYDSYPWVK